MKKLLWLIPLLTVGIGVNAMPRGPNGSLSQAEMAGTFGADPDEGCEIIDWGSCWSINTCSGCDDGFGFGDCDGDSLTGTSGYGFLCVPAYNDLCCIEDEYVCYAEYECGVDWFDFEECSFECWWDPFTMEGCDSCELVGGSLDEVVMPLDWCYDLGEHDEHDSGEHGG